MKVVLVWIASVLVVLVVLFGLAWIVQGNDFFMYKVFAPQYEKVRRETFEQTKSYNQGMVQELENMQFQYEQADDKHKAALGSIILHRAADFDETKLSSDLRSFIHKLKESKCEKY